MQTIIISGGLGKDAELKSMQNGDEVLSFSVGCTQGWGDRKQTNWYRVSLWGKRARTLSDYLRKGTKVVVQGELTIGEYNGKPQYDIRAGEIELMSKRQDDGGAAHEPQGRGVDPFVADELEDDIPFMSFGFRRDYRIARVI